MDPIDEAKDKILPIGVDPDQSVRSGQIPLPRADKEPESDRPDFTETRSSDFLTRTTNEANETGTVHTDSLVGTVIGERWMITDMIDQGGMSIVYKGKHLLMDKAVAIKVLSPTLFNNQTSLARFQQEAKAAGSLNHRNIITVQDVMVTTDNKACLIMDYVDGKSLSHEIERRGSLRPERAVPIFVQIADAFAEAHANGVIHRDLKPSNVMLVANRNERDFVKIVDFGIAKVISNDKRERQELTKTGDIFGSPLYMSPEQCWGRDTDARSDIYSMGCLMYETLIGKPPLSGANALETIHKHINDTPVPLADRSAPPAMKRLDAIVTKALAKQPSDRYQTMNDLKKDLELVLDTSEAGWMRKAIASRANFAKQGSLKIAVAVAALVGLAALIPLASTLWVKPPAQRASAEDVVMLWQMPPPLPPVDSLVSKKGEIELDMAIQFAKRHADPQQITEAYVKSADLYSREHKYGESITQLKKALSNGQQFLPPESEPVGECRADIAYCAFMQNNFEEARSNAKDAATILCKFDDPKVMRKLFSCGVILAEIDLKMRTFTLDLPLLHRMESIAHDQGVEPAIFTMFLVHLADLERNCGHTMTAMSLYDKAFVTFGEMRASQTNLAKCRFGNGLCETNLNPQRAEKLYTAALALAESDNNPDKRLIETIKAQRAALTPHRQWSPFGQ